MPLRTKSHIVVALLAMSSLCFGVLIYACTRTDALWLNQIISSLFSTSFKSSFPAFLSHLPFPQWVIFSLPDALWMLALMMVILMIWNFELNRKSIPWLCAALMAGLLFEAGQGLHLIQGTYDSTDLLSICIGAIIPISFTLAKSRVCKLNPGL